MGGLVHVDQSALDLQLNVISGDLDRAQFTLLAEGRMQVGDVQVLANVIGESHIVSVQIGDRQIHEVFACIEVQTESQRLFCGPINEKGDRVTTQVAGFTYSFISSVRDLTPDDQGVRRLKERVARAGQFQGVIGIMKEFPTYKDGAEIPVTIVYVSMMHKGLHIESIHTYPNESKLVFTTTTIKLGE